MNHCKVISLDCEISFACISRSFASLAVHQTLLVREWTSPEDPDTIR